ncbi:TraR/DksA family transcriptional regulator [Streptomyces sp. NPDC015171]|uniref:TraR/DksA family transcriptional regulator n=1 Tax=Streptomyces sp. NPDC015171 TaxID=3364945 RepID=UPI003703012C
MVAKKTAVQQPATGKSGARPATKKTAPGKTAAMNATSTKTAAEKATAEATAEKAVDATADETAGQATGGRTPAEESRAVKPDGKEAAHGDAAHKGAAHKDAAHKDVAAKKAAAKKAPAKKAAAEKAAAGKPAAGEEEAGKEEAGRKPAARAVAAKKTAADKIVAEKTVTGKAEGKGRKAAGEKAAAGKSTAKKAGAARAAKQTGATTVVAKKTPGTATTDQTAVPKARIAAAEPAELAVRPGEDPWTPEEVAEARAELESEMTRLREEISSSEASIVGLMRDSGDGAGDDQADTGTKNITREHEMALAANAREMLIQTERALDRLDSGTYGLCENCGNPIGKARMQAFPRATLCVECKQKQERRS